MIKRLFDIVTFPFYLTFQLISFPFKIAKIIIDDKIEKTRNDKSNELGKTSQKELLEIGLCLFLEFYSDYTAFIDSYYKDKRTFLHENEHLLSNYDNLEFKKLKPIELIYIFGDSKQKLCLTDWCGEEDEREIEIFLEGKLQIQTDWKHLHELRKGIDEEKQRDGTFIIDLLKAIDKDIEQLNKKLIFFDLDWDAYVYTVVDQTSYKTLINKFGTLFHGIDKLR